MISSQGVEHLRFVLVRLLWFHYMHYLRQHVLLQLKPFYVKSRKLNVKRIALIKFKIDILIFRIKINSDRGWSCSWSRGSAASCRIMCRLSQETKNRNISLF